MGLAGLPVAWRLADARYGTPDWIAPLIAAAAGVTMMGLMVIALAVGLLFVVPLFTIILELLLFEPPLPDAFKPSLLVLVAPFWVGYTTNTVTVSQTDQLCALPGPSPASSRRWRSRHCSAATSGALSRGELRTSST
jgi:tellurite resistance protein TehA-like permease